jgi:hypothetical protein
MANPKLADTKADRIGWFITRSTSQRANPDRAGPDERASA